MAGVVQMNVRIDSTLKQQGDRILQQQGFTPSQATRRLWEYVVEHNGVPDFMSGDEADAREAEKERKLAFAKEGAGLAMRLAYPDASTRPKGPSVEEIAAACRNRDDMYDEMLDDMLGMFSDYEGERARHEN